MKKANNKVMRVEMEALGEVWGFFKSLITNEAKDETLADFAEKVSGAAEIEKKYATGNPNIAKLVTKYLSAILSFILQTNCSQKDFSALQTIFNKAWDFFQTFYFIDYENEEDWNEVISTAREFERVVGNELDTKKYTVLSTQLITAVVVYLELLAEQRFNKKMQ